MRYQSQSVAYWYFAVAMALFGLQLVFGLLSAAKYLGPDPLLYILNLFRRRMGRHHHYHSFSSSLAARRSCGSVAMICETSVSRILSKR